MSNHREIIISLVETKPKHYSKMIQNSPELLEWVRINSLVQSDNFAEMVYSAVNQLGNVCKNGKIKKFGGVNIGFTGCGRAATCQCTRESVSAAVSEAKNSATAEQKAETNEKRNATNLERYGVINTGQTEFAKAKHREFYDDVTKVAEVTQKMKSTNIEKYGVETPQKLNSIREKTEQTMMERYGVKSAFQLDSVKEQNIARNHEYAESGKWLEFGYAKFKQSINDNYNFTVLTPVEEYKGVIEHDIHPLKFECNKCHTVIEKTFQYGLGLRCRVCS